MIVNINIVLARIPVLYVMVLRIILIIPVIPVSIKLRDDDSRPFTSFMQDLCLTIDSQIAPIHYNKIKILQIINNRYIMPYVDIVYIYTYILSITYCILKI